MSDSEQDLVRFAEKVWSRGGRASLLSILKAAKAEGISINMDAARPLIDMERKRGTFFCPEFIPRFIAGYLKDSAPRSILDAWAGTGVMLAPLVRTLEPSVAVGLSGVVEEQEIARLLYDGPAIEWVTGDPLSLLGEIDRLFDVVVACPPWGMRRASLTIVVEGRPVEVRDSLEHLVMLKALMLLESEGVGFFPASERFMLDRGGSTVLANLLRFGLYVDAALALPRGTFSPAITMGALLLVVRRQGPTHLFVGELTPDRGSSDILLKNLMARKEGKVPQLGALVDPEAFRSLETLVAQREVEAVVRRLGLSPTRLCKIAEVSLAKGGKEEEFLDSPNAVYLPLIGRSPAVSTLADLHIKPQNYAQLLLDPDKALADYVANFFNTPLGIKIRRLLSAGFIPKISKSALLTASVYLPDLATQAETLRVDSIITDSLTQLDALRRQLWAKPRKAGAIEGAVKALDPERDFESWIESVPFPLASILWGFYAEEDEERSWRQLIRFFEALTQFNATLLLSAFAADKAFYAEHAAQWIDEDPKYRDWMFTPGFGSWNVLGERLGKTVRRLVSDQGEKSERLLDLFGSPAPGFLDMLASKKLFAVLGEVKEYRDRWVGHAGITSARESSRRLALLTASLSKVRQIMSDHWTSSTLLQPVSSTFTGGVYSYKVRSLMGTRAQFRITTRKTRVPMDSQKLYVLHDAQLNPLELLPLVRLMESPRTQQNAFYFYNRRDKTGIRWVSYHFEEEAELFRPDDAVESVLSLLRPEDVSRDAARGSA